MKNYSLFRIPLFSFFLMIFFSASGQHLNFSYQSPVPGAHFINPEQTIIFKTSNGIDPTTIDPSDFLVVGSLSGKVSFKLTFSEDAKSIILHPDQDFQYGEKIEVEMLPGLKDNNGRQIQLKNFYFYIKNGETLSLLRDFKQSKDYDFALPEITNTVEKKPNIQVNDNSLPDDYPAPTVLFGGTHTLDDQYLFINMSGYAGGPYSNYLTILDNYGTPIYYNQTERSSRDFHTLGNGYLTYSDNNFAHPENEKYYLLDSSYVIFDSVMMGNGYWVDGHDMLLLENGHYLMMAYDPQQVDMSVVVPGGNPNATVTGIVIQEVDLSREVYFQWRSWDHFQITDATYDIDLTALRVDYVHANAFDIDDDGNILLSCRHMDEITKINFTTGDIIWRFGLNSENNMFTFENDPVGFSHQHDIRKLDNGHYSLFDNGNNHNPPFSQALEYLINEQTLEAELVWGYQREGVFSTATGSFRIGEDGKKLIGWGFHTPLNVTELNADNTLSFDLVLPQNVASYRAIKQPWKTNLFSANKKLSFGNYAGYSTPKDNYLFIHNQSADTIQITSTYKHLDEFYVSSPLPLQILPFGIESMIIHFEPGENGTYNDLLTLNYDNPGNTVRIARQVNLIGIWDENSPSVFISPGQGSTNVDPVTTVTITFDESVRLAFGGEITSSDIPDLVDFRINNYHGDEVTYNATINDEKTEITLIPENLLIEHQQYYIELKENLISDIDGNIILNAEISYFETGLINKLTDERTARAQVFPNPFNENLNIEYSCRGTWQVVLFDQSGKRIVQETTSLPKLILQTKAIRAGIYLLKIEEMNTGKTHSFKVMKHR